MPESLPATSDQRQPAKRTVRKKLTSDHRDVLRLLAYLMLRQGQARDAVMVLRGMLVLDPTDRHAQRSLIYAYLLLDEPERALEIAASYVPQPQEPYAATIHLLRARALWRLQRHQEAREALDHFVELRGLD